MKGETGWNCVYSVDVQQYLFLCLGPECSILDLYYSDFLCSCIWTGWDLPNYWMWERRVLQVLGTIGDSKYVQLIQTHKHFLPFISFHEISAQIFPTDLHEPARWKISTKRDAFLRKAKRDCVCFTEIQVQGRNSHCRLSAFGHMNKAYGLNMNCFKNCSEFSIISHPPTVLPTPVCYNMYL